MSFNPRALTSPDNRTVDRYCEGSVSIHGLLRALTIRKKDHLDYSGFNPRALTSPDRNGYPVYSDVGVSIHGLLRALTNAPATTRLNAGFNPRALTSPDSLLIISEVLY